PALEELGQVDAVSLAAGELADLLLLVGPLEVERGDIGPRGDLPLAERHLVEASGDLLEDGVLGVQGVTVLVDIRGDDAVANAKTSGVGLLLADDHPEERGLARAVGSDDADDAARRKPEREVLHQQTIAVALAHMFGGDDEVAQVRPRGNLKDN